MKPPFEYIDDLEPWLKTLNWEALWDFVDLYNVETLWPRDVCETKRELGHVPEDILMINIRDRIVTHFIKVFDLPFCPEPFIEEFIIH